MWLYLSPGFLSVVAHRTEPEKLLVRARHPDHIHAVFPGVEVIHMSHADYPYRAVLDRTVVQSTVADYIKNMAYNNFKASIDDFEYHDACIDIWRTMWAYGNRFRNGDD